MLINRYTGETIKLETSVLNQNGENANLTGVIAKFAYKLKRDRTSTVKDCVVESNTLSVTLNQSETMIAGEYEYEFRIKLNGDEESIDDGTIILIDRLLKGI